MPELIRAASPVFRLAIAGAYVAGIGIAAFGVILIWLGSTGSSDFTLFGQTFSSTNVGVSAIFIGGVAIVVLVRRSLRSADELFERAASIQAERDRAGRKSPVD